MPLVGLSIIAATATMGANNTPDLGAIARHVKEAALAKFAAKELKPDQISVSVAVLDRAAHSAQYGAAEGSAAFYPASTVKLFYLAYATRLLQDGKLKLSPELERSVHDMIVESSNDATALVLDTITGTTGGPELPSRELERWQDKRNAVNRWYRAMGYSGINVNQKTWNEGPYGRERQGLGPKFEHRNSLTPDACVRLMSEVALDRIIKPGTARGKDWSAWMKGFLHRAIPADSKDADYQSKAFSGGILPSGTMLWSKAGYTDTVRHDIVWAKLPNGHEYVWAIFTKGQSTNEAIIPFVATDLLKELEGGEAVRR